MILETPTRNLLLNFKNFVYNKLCCVYVSSLFPKYSTRELFSQNTEKRACFNQVSFLILLRPVILQVSKRILKCKLLLSLTVSARPHASVVLLLLYWQHQKWSIKYSDDFWVNKFRLIFTHFLGWYEKLSLKTSAKWHIFGFHPYSVNWNYSSLSEYLMFPLDMNWKEYLPLQAAGFFLHLLLLEPQEMQRIQPHRATGNLQRSSFSSEVVCLSCPLELLSTLLSCVYIADSKSVTAWLMLYNILWLANMMHSSFIIR